MENGFNRLCCLSEKKSESLPLDLAVSLILTRRNIVQKLETIAVSLFGKHTTFVLC